MTDEGEVRNSARYRDGWSAISELQASRWECAHVHRGAEKLGAKRKTRGLMALFFCPLFFADSNAAPIISVEDKYLFDAYAFQGGQNTVAYWTLVAITLVVTKFAQVTSPFQKHLIANFGRVDRYLSRLG